MCCFLLGEVQGQRGAGQVRQGVQQEGGGRAPEDLRHDPGPAGQQPHQHREHRRVQGLLPEDEGRLLPDKHQHISRTHKLQYMYIYIYMHVYIYMYNRERGIDANNIITTHTPY